MFNFLHSFSPQPILFSFGPIKIYWYGFFIVLGIVSGISISLFLASRYNLKKERIIDMAFWFIVCGLLGARLYHILIEFSYYKHNIRNIFKIWQGGLAIHGGIIGGLIVLFYFSHKHINYFSLQCFSKDLMKKEKFWFLASVVAPAIALGQAIGRWGNYFNQELFGYPTSLPWGIPIDPINRPLNYFSYNFFHPTFLYESFGDFLIFIFLLFFHIWIIKNKKSLYYNFLLVLFYLFFYSLLRFGIEFIRIDPSFEFCSLRFPQIISLLLMIITIILFFQNRKNKFFNILVDL